jgi:hypothetical protein
MHHEAGSRLSECIISSGGAFGVDSLCMVNCEYEYAGVWSFGDQGGYDWRVAFGAAVCGSCQQHIPCSGEECESGRRTWFIYRHADSLRYASSIADRLAVRDSADPPSRGSPPRAQIGQSITLV